MDEPDILLRDIATAHRDRVANCIDHDLAGIHSGQYVFTVCRKCGGRFKVRITEESTDD